MSKRQLTLWQKFKLVDHFYWSGVLFFGLVIVFIVYLGHKMTEKMMNAQDMPVSTLQIIGTRPYSSDLEIHQVLWKLSENESFFSLNVEDVQQRLENIPWIKRVAVRRQWPNGLIIHVTDQSPVAYWNETQLLNDSGEVFSAPTDRISSWLPHFSGADDIASNVLSGYRALWPLLESEGLTLSEISLTPRQSWNVTLANGSKLVLGRGNDVIRNVRMERFLKVYKHVLPQGKQIDYVDLRYDAGFAVNWKKQLGDTANNEQG
ncbi:MAG: cell division protein FtsQ/DivIB [Psychrobium sp.]